MKYQPARDGTALVRDDVYRSLRADIIACRLPPGAELREGDLAQRFDVSKSPVRDALHRLEVERLVSVLPRRGYRITPISITDAREMLEFRSVVEQACAVKAADAASDAALRDLDQFRRFDAVPSEDNFVPYNRSFHQAINRLSGNRRMSEYSRDLGEQYDRLVRVSISMTPPRDYDGFMREHCEIIDALQARDGRKAARLLGAHIESGEKRIIGVLSCAPIVP